MTENIIDLRCGDCIEVMKDIPDNSIDCIITSPPYYNLRDYGKNGQIGNENTVEGYIGNLMAVFKECYRVLSKSGSFWLNIADVYQNRELLCIPDRIKIELVKIGFICRNEVIWHKPNAMPCSAKNRFNNDYEKFYFFTKSKDYYFETQYEPMKTVQTMKKQGKKGESKYLSIEQESSVRQGMNRSRGCKLIEVRNNLPRKKNSWILSESKRQFSKSAKAVRFRRQKLSIGFGEIKVDLRIRALKTGIKSSFCWTIFPKNSAKLILD